MKSLIELKKKYKERMEEELRVNRMQGITFSIAKVFDELFDELIRIKTK